MSAVPQAASVSITCRRHIAERAAKKGKEIDPDEVAPDDHRVPELWHARAVDRAATVQWAAAHPPRGRGRRVRPALPAPRDRPGHLRQLPQRHERRPPQAALRDRQTGKSFRNEITPGNFIFRTREFEQMEMEFFVEPGTDEQWHEYWLQNRWDWYTDLGINPDNLRFFEHPQEKLSHYSKRTVDIEYRFQFAGSEWAELEGIANRTDFDLKTHSEHSGTDLSYFDQATGERWVPFVIEPAAGLTRCVLAFLLDAYAEDEAPNTKGGVDKRTVLRFDPRLAPVKAAVLPLSRNEALSPKGAGPGRTVAQALERGLRRRRADRPPLPPPGRDRHPVLHHRGLRHARGQRGHRPGARHDGAGAHRRVALMRDFGLVDAPAVAEVVKAGEFYGSVSAERAADLTSDVFLTWSENPSDMKTFEDNKLIGQIPAIKDGHAYAEADKPTALAVTNPTPLSIPVVIDKFIPKVAAAIGS
jgi:hypothetical protein